MHYQAGAGTSVRGPDRRSQWLVPSWIHCSTEAEGRRFAMQGVQPPAPQARRWQHWPRHSTLAAAHGGPSALAARVGAAPHARKAGGRSQRRRPGSGARRCHGTAVAAGVGHRMRSSARPLAHDWQPQLLRLPGIGRMPRRRDASMRAPGRPPGTSRTRRCGLDCAGQGLRRRCHARRAHCARRPAQRSWPIGAATAPRRHRLVRRRCRNAGQTSASAEAACCQAGSCGEAHAWAVQQRCRHPGCRLVHVNVATHCDRVAPRRRVPHLPMRRHSCPSRESRPHV